MDFRTYIVAKDDDNRRIDRIVRRFLPDLPLPAVYRLLRTGLVRLDGRKVAPDCRVFAGSTLEIALSVLSAGTAVPARDPAEPRPARKLAGDGTVPGGEALDIILETDDLLFVNKPAGMPVHGSGGLDRLVPPSSAALESLSFRTGPLHRLDSGTTGLIAFSRSLAGARWFTEAVRDHRLGKQYLGIAEGILDGPAEWKDRSDDGKEMHTFAWPVACGKTMPLSLVRYRIVTGRKHQIRIQTNRHGHPLCGDLRHGGGPLPFATDAEKKDARSVRPGYFLHAWMMTFPPDRPAGLPETLIAPFPPAFARAVATVFGKDVLANIREGAVYWMQNEELQ